MFLSKSAEDAWKYAQGEGLDDSQLVAWRELCQSAYPYPAGEFIPPFRKNDRPIRTRGIIGASIYSDVGERYGYPVPRTLWLSDDQHEEEVRFTDSLDDVDNLCATLFTKETRSKFIVFKDGAKTELRLIAQRWGIELDRRGYAVELMVNGGHLRAIIIKKSKHRWYLVDWQGLTGRPATEMIDYARKRPQRRGRQHNPAHAVWRAASYVQWFVLSRFSVGLGLTIGATSIRAAAAAMPPEAVKWRPLPLMVAMMRAGKGFRGGAVRGRRYRGKAYMVDLNRAYTASLGESLPLRSAVGSCVRAGTERNGVYLCRVIGPGRSPVYIGVWSAEDRLFEAKWATDNEGKGLTCVLPTSEFAGIRALGYRIEPGIGCVFTRTFSLASYVGRIQAANHHFGARSVEARLTKLLGNTVFGKFAADPERRTVRLAEQRPGLDWYIWIDSDGYPVEQVWEQSREKYQWSQHIDIAAVVTGRVRSWVYEASRKIEDAGGWVAGIQTDCLVTTIDPRNVLDMDQEKFGSWKLVADDEDGVVVGSNCWSVGDHTAVPQHPSPGRADVVSLFERVQVEFTTERRGTPLPGRPVVTRMVKRINPPALAP